MMKFCLILLLCASSTFISDGTFGSSSSSVLSERRRSLLQAKKPCPVNFKFQNYTIITSKCKGPLYSLNLCCPALKEFMCPYSQDLNDSSNDCASTMLTYINLYGNYPPSLFANECWGTMLGLECPPLPPGSSQSHKAANNNSNTAITVLSVYLPLLMLPIATLQFIIM